MAVPGVGGGVGVGVGVLGEGVGVEEVLGGPFLSDGEPATVVVLSSIGSTDGSSADVAPGWVVLVVGSVVLVVGSVVLVVGSVVLVVAWVVLVVAWVVLVVLVVLVVAWVVLVVLVVLVVAWVVLVVAWDEVVVTCGSAKITATAPVPFNALVANDTAVLELLDHDEPPPAPPPELQPKLAL